MKRLAATLAVGALALIAGSMLVVPIGDQANAAVRDRGGGAVRSGGGGGGGAVHSGGGGRPAAARPASRPASARQTGTQRHVNTGRTTSTKSSKVGRGGSGKQKSAGKPSGGKQGAVHQPKIGKSVGTAKLGGKPGNTPSAAHTGPGGIKPGPGKGGATAGLKPGPVGPGLKPGPGKSAGPGKPPPGGFKPPPGGFKPTPAKFALINHKYVSFFPGPYQIFWAGAWVSLAALAVIPAIEFGGAWFEPYGYVALAQPACSGLAPEGFELTWQDVPIDGGGFIPQCVAFYPRGRAAPAPVAAVGAAQPVAAAMAQGCLVDIYAQASFTGTSSDVTADQPRLSEYGWDKQISSLDVKSGTWDFYSEANYGGQMLRLQPGQYANLDAWDKQISSFMCTQMR